MRLHRFSWARTAIVLATLVATVSGCGAQSGPKGEVVPGHLDGSVAHVYASLSEIEADSAAVVVGRVVGSKVGGPADEAGTSRIGTLLTTVQVISSIKGSLAKNSEVVIRQLATQDTAVPIGFTLEDRGSYVLFLQPFEFHPDAAPTGQYVITGAQGAYKPKDVGSISATTPLKLVTGPESELPDSTTVAAISSSMP